MTVRDAYGGARFCLAMAREEPEERRDWLTKAKAWRELARWIRSRKRRAA